MVMVTKVGFKLSLGFLIVAQQFAALPCFAQQAVKADLVQNELLKASLPHATTSNGQPATITDADLDRATKKLKAAEARLLEQANQKPIVPRLPGTSGISVSTSEELDANSKTNVAAKLAERDLAPEVSKDALPPADKASLDLDKVMQAIDKSPSDSSVAALTNPAPAEVVKDPNDLTKRNADLEMQLQTSQERVNSLLKELDDTRNRLMIAETQVERLSSIIDSKSRDPQAQANRSNTGNAAIVQKKPVSPSSENAALHRERPADDMQVATVTADKVLLRTGPGKENSPLMAVTKGTRLAVETRNGDWYRVIAPSGVRAWVSGDVVAFGLSMNASGQASRVKGFSEEVENDDGFAFSRKGGTR